MGDTAGLENSSQCFRIHQPDLEQSNLIAGRQGLVTVQPDLVQPELEQPDLIADRQGLVTVQPDLIPGQPDCAVSPCTSGSSSWAQAAAT